MVELIDCISFFVSYCLRFQLHLVRIRNLIRFRSETVKAAENVHMLLGSGGNIGVCTGDDGVFLVDDQFAPLTEKIKAAIGKISNKDIRFLINTHWHFDHVGGNENIGEAGGSHYCP